MTLLLFYLFLALTVSFLCSIAEAVLLSSPLSFLRSKEKSKNAERMIRLKQDIDKPLSAILSLNTIAHTVGAAGVGSQATKIFGEAYFGLVSALLTIMILVFTEILPKTIGTRYWRKLTFVSALIQFMVFIAYPLVIVSSLITKVFSSKKEEHTTSREEISAMVNIGLEEGVFGAKENKIIQNLIRLKDIKVSDVMTPRVVVSLADENMLLTDFAKTKSFFRFSRIPVFSENEERISGYVFRQTIYEELAKDSVNLRLKDIKRKVIFVPEKKELFNLWELLLEKKEHIAIAIDEYGGIGGLITMEDVIETLLGFEILDEKDVVVDMRQYARDRWQKKQEKYKMLNQIDDQMSKQE